jgi:enoyl-[acyl-carrier protein] reductase II
MRDAHRQAVRREHRPGVRARPDIVDFVIDQGVRFVTTSAGNPERYTEQLKAAGLTVFPRGAEPRRGAEGRRGGVDGLVVEGGEGGGFKNPRDVATMVLLPLVRSKVDVPIIAAGGFVDGRTMAAAFALGAEAVQMGTRMVSALSRPCTTTGSRPSSTRGRPTRCS